MKKLLAFIFLLFCITILKAEQPGPGFVTKAASRLSAVYELESVYQSTSTCGSSSLSTVWISSPFPANLYAINVTSAGTNGPLIAVWDGITSTGSSRLVSIIDGRTNREHIYNVAFSSYLAVDNYSISGVPACIDIIYKVR